MLNEVCSEDDNMALTLHIVSGPKTSSQKVAVRFLTRSAKVVAVAMWYVQETTVWIKINAAIQNGGRIKP
jgi:hypothetical protein